MKKKSVLAAAVFASLIALCDVGRAENAPRVLFSLNFDNDSLTPRSAAGNPTPDVLGRIEFRPGFRGSAALFGNGNCVRFKAPGNFNPNAGTIEFRFKLLPVPDGRYKRHFLTFYTNEAERFYLRQLTKTDFHGFFRGKKGGAEFGFAFSDVPKDAWHHYAFNWRHLPNQRKTRLTVYVDGRKRVDEIAAMTLPAFRDGWIILGAYDKGLISLNGLLDDFRIYDGVKYTKNAYPEFFVFPPVEKLDSLLARVRQGLRIIPVENVRTETGTKVAEWSGRLERLKKSRRDQETYFDEYTEIENGLRTLWRAYSAPALWWKDRKSGRATVLAASCMIKTPKSGWEIAPTRSQEPKLAACGGEWSAFQLLVYPSCFRRIGKCAVRMEPLKGDRGDIAASNIRFFRVGTVGGENDGKQWADPLYPIEEAFPVPATAIQAVWCQIHVPEKTPAGTYRGTVFVETDGAVHRSSVALRVFGFPLPRTPRIKTAFGFAMTPLVRYYRGRDWKPIARRYQENMLRHRVSIKSNWLNGIYYDTTFLAPKIIKGRSGRWRMDFADYDRQLDKLLPLGLNTIMVGYRSWDGNYRRVEDKSKATRLFPYFDAADHWKMKKLALPVVSPETEKFGKWVVKTWYDHLKARGLAEMAYTYFVDEPSSDMFGVIETFCRWSHEVAPDLKNMITHAPVKQCPSVDIWCPLAVTPEVRAFATRGGVLWKYVCCAPLSPSPNFFISQPAVENRLPFWEAYAAGARGFVYYETARSLYFWKSGKTTAGISLRWRGSPGTEGDGFLVYPGKDGPINTVRFEYVRMGIQDVEYFLMLKDLANSLPPDSALRGEAKRLLSVDDDLLRAAIRSKQWSGPEASKRAVGEMIERILAASKR